MWNEDGQRESAAMELISNFARSAGLGSFYDAVGNLWVTVTGEHPSEQAVVCGSHLDSVPCGGNYDGAAGVVAGLLALIELANGRELRSSVRLVVLRGEESAWFGKCYLGSLALFGRLGPEDLARKRRDTGRTLRDHMRDCGAMPECTMSPAFSRVKAFLELHIEQGPVLERLGLPVGIVTGIRGNVRHNVVCHGEAGHSGTTPMHMRHDPVMATASFLSWLGSNIGRPGVVTNKAVEDIVFTVGRLHTDAARDAVSVIADRVEFSLEWRSLSSQILTDVGAQIVEGVQRVETVHGVHFDLDAAVRTEPAKMDESIQRLLLDTCRKLEVPYTSLPSGAGHDAAVFASEGVPSGMIFVRNANGSHNPREEMRLDDFSVGVKVLRSALEALALEGT